MQGMGSVYWLAHLAVLAGMWQNACIINSSAIANTGTHYPTSYDRHRFV